MISRRIKINIELHGDDAAYFDRMAALAGMKRGGLARSIIETVIADDRAEHDDEGTATVREGTSEHLSARQRHQRGVSGMGLGGGRNP